MLYGMAPPTDISFKEKRKMPFWWDPIYVFYKLYLSSEKTEIIIFFFSSFTETYLTYTIVYL